MKAFDNLVEKLRQELVELVQKKGTLSDTESVQKSQELDELLNIFYTFIHSKKQDCTAHVYKEIEGIAINLYKKGLTDKNQLLKLKELCRKIK